MCFLRQNHKDTGGRRRVRCPRAFVLVEGALAVLIVMLGAGLVLMWTGQMSHRQNCERYIHDLGVFSAVFEDYYAEHKTWPPTSEAGIVWPADLAEALQDTPWLKRSPFGGSYGWVAPDPVSLTVTNPGRRWNGRGAVTLTSFSPGFPLTLDELDLLEIDAKIDDGKIATGRFRTGFNGWPVFLVGGVKQ